jgi:hypothetical protein
MATFFRTKIAQNIGTAGTTVLDTVTSRFTVIGCNLANTTDYDVNIDIIFHNNTTMDEGYYIKKLVIPPYNSAKLVTNGEKIILAENHTMVIVSDTDDSVDAIISYAEIV